NIKNYRGRIETDVSVLDALEQLSGLENLTIHLCSRTTIFPNWMVSLAKLKRLNLRFGSTLECLPPLGKLQFLEFLHISDIWLLEKEFTFEKRPQIKTALSFHISASVGLKTMVHMGNYILLKREMVWQIIDKFCFSGTFETVYSIHLFIEVTYRMPCLLVILSMLDQKYKVSRGSKFSVYFDFFQWT
ncbi:hypothetical protein CFP56_007899, partial [Quercus suber]